MLTAVKRKSAEDRYTWAAKMNNDVLVMLNYYMLTVVVSSLTKLYYFTINYYNYYTPYISIFIFSIHNLFIIRVINEFLKYSF